MDANGTKFHLILGREDWARCSVDGVELGDLWQPASPPQESSAPNEADVGVVFDNERTELTLQPRLFKFVAAPKDTRPDLVNRRGAGRDRYGNWYWIDETNSRIRVRSSGTRLVSDFWPPASGSCCAGHRPGQFQPRDSAPTESLLTLKGLAVTEDHYLVVGVLKPAGLLIFDLHAGGDPRQLMWPPEVEFEPLDMAARPGGGVWILDATHHCYWGLDAHFNPITTGMLDQDPGPATVDYFQPLEGGGATPAPRRTFPRHIALDISSPVEAINPIAIESLPDGTVLILDHDPDERIRFSKIYRYDLDRRIAEVSTEAMVARIEREQAHQFRLVGYDFAFVPAHTDDDGREVSDRLYVAADDGNQTYAFRLCQEDGRLEWQPLSEYLPMRLFGGKALVAAGTDVYYDFSENWIPLRAQSHPRYVDEATLMTNYLDGVEPDCVWHRLMIDACIPPETKVEIWSRAANESFDLELTPWLREPRLHLRGDGSELPYLQRHGLRNGNGRAADRDGTWELLFQQTRGRYLQLQIRLSGNERTSPRLRAARAYFPRFSYLDHYLPSIYREDNQSAWFLDRFLANFEGMYTSLEDKIAAVQVLFDVRSAPRETLAWLAQWFGVVFDPAWDEAKQRLLIRHAMEFFQFRGTIHGLKMALHLAFDSCVDEKIFELPSACASGRDSIRIVEKYLTRQSPGVIFGDASDLVGPRRLTTTPRWIPSQGGTNLSTRYTEFINSRSATPQPATVFPTNPPKDPAQLAAWQEFARQSFGFVPSFAPAPEVSQWQSFLRNRYSNIATLNEKHQTTFADWTNIVLPRDWSLSEHGRKDWQDYLTTTQGLNANTLRVFWQEFLARRYGRIGRLNDVYSTHWPSFEMVSLFDVLPPDGAPLEDWYQFESVAIQQHLTAHRFTVLLPAPVSLAFSPDEQQLRFDLSRRIIELEKPAHTVFEVKFYWEMFRIGEARLQFDTLLQQGSRAPQLLPRMTLDRGFIGSSYLAPPLVSDANF